MANCLFVRRRLNILKLPTLAELFANINIKYSQGVNANTATTLSITTAQANSHLPASGVAYILSFCNGNVGVWKVIDRVVQSTPIKQSSSSYGGIAVNVGSSTSTTYCWYYSGGYTEVASYSGATSVNGATMLIVDFPSYTDAQVDAVLSRATFTSVVGRNAVNSSTTRTTDKNHAYYWAAKNTNFDAWSCNGTTWTKIKGTSSAAASISSSYLSLGSVYGGSIIGID